VKIDLLLSPAVKVPLTGLTTTMATLGEVIPLGAPRNQGLAVDSLHAGWVVTIAGATSAGAATLELQFLTSDTANMAAPVTLFSRTGITVASAAGRGIQFFIPVEDSDRWKQYLAVQARYGTAALTGGTISVEFTANYRKWRAYPAETGR
jgi:hypothetical protein